MVIQRDFLRFDQCLCFFVFLSMIHFVPVTPEAKGSFEDLAVIRSAPEVELIEAGTGEPFRLSGLQGKAVLVGFVYTTCNGSCPATTHTMYRAQETLKASGLWGDRVEFVSITLDPKTDTPEVLDRYAKIFGADRSAWHFLTGDSDQVAKVIEAWDMWARIGPSGNLDHPSRIFLLDPEGRQREIYNLEFLDPESVLDDVREVLGERAKKLHQDENRASRF